MAEIRRYVSRMTSAFLTGLTGAIILVIGAAYPPEKVSHPIKSVKNWLFLVGALIMLAYSTMNYLAGGTIFFVILQLFANATSVFMMLNLNDRFDTPFIITVGMAMVVWSLTLFEDYSTIFFIIGITGIGLGYALEMGTFRRNMALTVGSILIAFFSYLKGDGIFLWLNVFFALFSGYYALRTLNHIHYIDRNEHRL